MIKRYYSRSSGKMHLPTLAGLSITSLAYASSSRAIPSSTVTGSLVTSSGTLQIPKGVSCACSKLSQSFPANVILPGSSNYTTQTVDNYWDIRADLTPACVFVPDTAAQVSHALKVVNVCGSQFAVRGGGHMNVSSHTLVHQGTNRANIIKVPWS